MTEVSNQPHPDLHFIAHRYIADPELCASGLVVQVVEEPSGAVVSELRIAPGVRLVADAEGVRTTLIGFAE